MHKTFIDPAGGEVTLKARFKIDIQRYEEQRCYVFIQQKFFFLNYWKLLDNWEVEGKSNWMKPHTAEQALVDSFRDLLKDREREAALNAEKINPLRYRNWLYELLFPRKAD